MNRVAGASRDPAKRGRRPAPAGGATPARVPRELSVNVAEAVP